MVVKSLNVQTGELTEREYTSDELENIALSQLHSEPSPLEKIRALEQQYADKQSRITRQSLLILALDKAMELPQAAGMTREEVHSILMVSDQGYSDIYNLEQQIELLRAQL